MLKRSLFILALMLSAAPAPSWAEDLSVRVDQLEGQIRQLTGQIEVLTYQLKQMQNQRKLGSLEQTPGAAAPATQEAEADSAAAATVAARKKVMLPAPQVANAGLEQVGDQAVQNVQIQTVQAQSKALAPPPVPLGKTTRAAKVNDGNFQGQLLVAPGAEGQTGEKIEPVAATPETPDDLFLRSQKSLLQLQYADAEVGFKEFLAKYPDHNLTGAVYYWLGETAWAQQDFANAAKNYMVSYKQYPKGSRAPLSLFKLGQSMARLGEKDQACAFMGSVDTEFPTAVEVKKRAQAEFRRNGC